MRKTNTEEQNQQCSFTLKVSKDHFAYYYLFTPSDFSNSKEMCTDNIHFLEPSVNWLPGVVLFIVILKHWTTIRPFIGIKILCMGARLARRPSAIVAWVLYLTQHYSRSLGLYKVSGQQTCPLYNVISDFVVWGRTSACKGAPGSCYQSILTSPTPPNHSQRTATIPVTSYPTIWGCWFSIPVLRGFSRAWNCA